MRAPPLALALVLTASPAAAQGVLPLGPWLPPVVVIANDCSAACPPAPSSPATASSSVPAFPVAPALASRPAPSVIPETPRTPAEWEALRQSSEHREWYGWQTTAADGGAAALLLFAASTGQLSPASATGLAALYGLGSPTVHFAHRNVGAGIASLVLRVAAPLARVVLRPSQDRRESDPGGLRHTSV